MPTSSHLLIEGCYTYVLGESSMMISKQNTLESISTEEVVLESISKKQEKSEAAHAVPVMKQMGQSALGI